MDSHIRSECDIQKPHERDFQEPNNVLLKNRISIEMKTLKENYNFRL